MVYITLKQFSSEISKIFGKSLTFTIFSPIRKKQRAVDLLWMIRRCVMENNLYEHKHVSSSDRYFWDCYINVLLKNGISGKRLINE
jgi:hypothetical protein